LANGPRSAAEIQAEAKARDITPKSLRSARQALGVRTEKVSMAGGWVCTLPKMPSTPEDALLKNRAPSDPEGTFGGPEGRHDASPSKRKGNGFDREIVGPGKPGRPR